MSLDPWRSAGAALDVLAAGFATQRQIEQRREQRVAAMLQHAWRHSRLYRERWRDAVGPDGPDASRIADLPVVRKAELMGRFDDWVTDPEVTWQRVQAFVADPSRAGLPFLGRYAVWESSGTTGEPGVFVHDEHALAVYDALEACRRDAPEPWRRWLDPLYVGERIAFVGALGGHFASHATVQRLRRLHPWLAATMRSFSILQPVSALVAQLDAFGPSIVATYPTAAVMLADERAAGSLRIAPREIWTGGETLGMTQRRHVEQVFGCALRNSYGASEFLAIGWECRHGRLHANTDWLLLEPVDAQHRPVPAGVEPATTLLTNLANRVQPIVRYDLGDRIVFDPAACACGSPLPVFEVQGRRDDPLALAGDDGRAVTLLPLALTTVLEDEAGVFDFQLCRVDAHTLRLTLPAHGPVAAGGSAVPSAARDRVEAGARAVQVLRRFAARHGLASLRIETERVAALPLGRSGKLQRVVAELPPAAGAAAAVSGAAVPARRARVRARVPEPAAAAHSAAGARRAHRVRCARWR